MRFVICLLLWSSLVQAAGPRDMTQCGTWFTALGQNVQEKDYAPIRVVRAKDARLAFVNCDLIRADFPELATKSDDAIRAWVLENYAYVTEYANDNREIHHSGVAVDTQDSRSAIVPHTYGRAMLMEAKSGSGLVDLKGVGVTYATKDGEGAVVLDPSKVSFKKEAHHQNGLMKMGEAYFEANAGEILEESVGPQGRGANQTYFILDLGTKVYSYSPNGERVGEDPAVILGRQANVRFYRLDEKIADEAREHFLYTNAKLFWKGFYHGSMNRYNADDGIYIDFGTVTGLPERAYRLTAMSFVPYGLSDFYGLFGEWSAGQATSSKGNLSPFHSRSWGVFLANVGVAMGLGPKETVAFASKESRLAGRDLHEILIDINSQREPQFRSDPTKKTYSKMDLISVTEQGEKGAESLVGVLDTPSIYRAIMENARRGESSSAESYLKLLRLAVVDANPQALAELAKSLVEVEALIREGYQEHPAAREIDLAQLGGRRIGEQLLRSRMDREAYQAQSLFTSDPTDGPALSILKRYRDRLRKSEPKTSELPLSEEVSHELADISRSGDLSAYLLRLTGRGLDKDIPVLVPNAGSLFDPGFQSMLSKTVGLIWRDTREAGEQFGHSYIRVGTRIYDLQIAKTIADDFMRMMKNRFFYDFGMKGNGGKAPYYETVFAVSESSIKAMTKYFEDRAEGKATVDGKPFVPHFDPSGKGEPWGDGIVRENCGAFACSFAHSRWWKDYPGLEQAAKEIGLSRVYDGAHVALQALMDPNASPLGFISWSGSRGNKDPFNQHRVFREINVPHEVDFVQAWPLTLKGARFQGEADAIRDWALEQGLNGYQASMAGAVSKSGELMAPAHRFNFVRLGHEAVDAFERDIATDHFTLWWRWEPNGEFGHVWAGVGKTIYDQAAGGYGRWETGEFLRNEIANGFRLKDQPTFFVGLTLKMDPQDIAHLNTFFEARRTGVKADGSSVPKPDYVWDAPFVKDEVTPGRCGMFATSFANPAWQALFPELPLKEIAEKYGVKYGDGSLFLLHRQFHLAQSPTDFFVIGPQEHVRAEGFEKWTLPLEALPENVKETMGAAWSAMGTRQVFKP